MSRVALRVYERGTTCIYELGKGLIVPREEEDENLDSIFLSVG